MVVWAKLLVGRWVGATASLVDLDDVVCVGVRRVEDGDSVSFDKLRGGGEGVGVVDSVVWVGGSVF